MGVIRNIKRKIKQKTKQKVKQGGEQVPSVDAIKEFSPRVILYVAGSNGSIYQANMWLEVLEGFDPALKVAVVVRKLGLFKALHETSLPVFLLKSLSDLSCIEEAGVKTVLYPANAMQTLQCFRFYKLNHFFINHGESDKAFNQNQILQAYDKLLLSGPLALQRLEKENFKLHADQIEFVGRPQVNLLLDQPCPPPSQIKTVLYAPTWEGFYQEVNYTSVNEYGVAMIDALLSQEGIHVIFKPHPFTGSRKNKVINESLKHLKSLSSKPNFTLVPADDTIYECMNKSDLMITDISSTIGDYIYTEKPMILTNPASKGKEYYHETFHSSKALYFLERAEDIVSLVQSIDQSDDMLGTRLSLKKDILGDFETTYLERFEQVIKNSL